MEENKETQVLVLSGNVNYSQLMSTLTPEQKEYYLKLCASVSINDRTSLQVLGADIVEANSRTADTMLSSVRSSDHQIVKECLVDTVKQLRMVNPDELDPDNKWRNFAMRIPILKNVVHSVENMQLMAKTAEDNVNIIFDRMKASSRNLATNNSTLEQMFIENGNLIESMNELIMGLKLLEVQESQKLDEMRNNPEIAAWDIQRQNTYVDSIRQEISNKLVSVQDMENSQTMICTLQSTNDALINACGVAINQTLPQWKKSIAMAIQADETKNVLDTVKILNEKMNEVILTTADTVAQCAVDTAKANTSTAIKIQTLEQAQKKMFDAMRQVKRVIEDGKNSYETIERRVEAMQTTRQSELKAIANKK